MRITIVVDVPDWTQWDSVYRHAHELATLVRNRTWQDVSGIVSLVSVGSSSAIQAELEVTS